MIWRSFLLSIVFLFSTSDAQDCSKAPTDDIKFICKQIEGWAANVSTIPANLLPGTRPLTANFIPTNPSSQNECFTIACLCRFFGGSGGEFCTVRGQSMRKGIRREYRVMSDNERQRYHAAMWAIKNNGAYDQLAQVHSQFQSSPGAHSGPAFLPWHREYIKRLEFALRRVDPSVTLPYWDSTLDGVIPNPSESSLFTPELMGQQSGDGSVRNGAFANWLILGNSRVFRREVGFRGGPFSERDINAVFAQNDVSRVLANTAPRAGCPNPASFDAFEYSHGSPHIWIGGDMLITTTATHDPIFWNHHAFVDMIWEQWRLSRQSRGARETAYPQSNSNCHSTSHYGNTIMTPFNPLVNTDGLSNMYTDFLYEYAPRPSCSANNINGCGSRFLFCDLSHGGARCSSKIRIGGNCFGYTRNEDRCYNGICVNNVCRAGTTTTQATTQPTTQGTTAPPSANCWNYHYCCEMWQSVNYCRDPRYIAYMSSNCRPSCGQCGGQPNWRGPTCTDLHVSCRAWALRGECTRNRNYMWENCKWSCNQCGLLNRANRARACGFSGFRAESEPNHLSAAAGALLDAILPIYGSITGRTGARPIDNGSPALGKIDNLPPAPEKIDNKPPASAKTCDKVTWLKTEEKIEGGFRYRAVVERIPYEDRCYQGVCINNVCVAGQTTTTTTQGPTTFGPTTTSSTGQTCWNEHECCAAWAFRGECTRNPAYMLANCRAECPGGCTRTWNPNIDCEDRNSNCGTWSRQGQCTSNLNWMRENCRRSCNRCGTTREQVCGSSGQGGGETRTTSPMTTPMTPGTTPTTTQTTTQSTTPSTTTVRTTTSTPTSDCYNFHYCCEVWQAVNYCDVDRWSAYMSRNCRPSCNKCTGQPNWKGPACVDIHPSCSAWAYQGECVRNKAYMHENCKKSCNQCSLLSRITRFLVCGFSSVSHSQSDPISPSNSSLVPILPVYRNSLRITEGRFEGVDASPPGFPKVCDKVQWKDMVEKHKRGEKYFATVRRGFC